MDAFAAYSGYMMGMIEARKAEPTDDLVSVLVHAEVEGSRLEDHQIVTEVLLLLIGGDETTRHTLSGGTRQLLLHPDQHQRLAKDLGLLPNAIEEMLRWTAPVKNMARTITADTEFHGTQLHQGEKMILLFESANFDEKVFDDPEAFNIERYPNNHLAFGFGTHFCLGNQLARLELSIMQTRLLQRIPDMRLASDADAAAAAGELRVRSGEDAGGLHPDKAATRLALNGRWQVPDGTQAPSAFAHQQQLLLVMLINCLAMAHADHDRVRALAAYQLIQRILQSLVKRRSRLVEEYRLRLGKQNAGEPDPLLLARGEHPSPVLGLVESMAEVWQRHLIQHVLQFGIGNVAGRSGVGHHRAQITQRDVGQLRQKHCLGALARPAHRSRRERPQLGKAAKQGGLPVPDLPVITRDSPGSSRRSSGSISCTPDGPHLHVDQFE